MIRVENIHSLSDFQRNTSQHLKQMKESGQPVVLTINGKAELVVQSTEGYQAMLSQIELYESALAAQRGWIDYKEGRSISLADYRKKIKKGSAKSVLNEEP